MKQATLFRAWNPKPGTTGAGPRQAARNVEPPPDSAEDVVVLSDDDDEFLVQAMDKTLEAFQSSKSGAEAPSAMFPPAPPPPQKALENLPGFDVVAGQTWIYPTNYPVRDYQFNIVQACLFKNTMVILPTGLGKTFIAAVVMYNFYRWYPTGKIIFTAPTKPLVAQQIEACYKVMGIPLEDTIEMTGNTPAARRATAWREKRVFFLTPQVMMNDLLRNALKPQDVKCLVIDEAHKALGNYSYCSVVQEIMKYTNQFRVVALSATPGSDINAVRQVLSNLMISHVELRSEESIDIQKYTQKRTIDKVVVPLGDEIVEVKGKFLKVVCTYLERLEHHRALPRLNPESLGKYRMLLLKESFQKNPPLGMAPRLVGQLQGDFALLISLYHAYELLLAHGLRPFFHFLKGIVDGEKSQPRVRYELMHHPGFNELYSSLKTRLGASDDAANETLHPSSTASSLFETSFRRKDEDQASSVVGHPKLIKLEEIVLEHFRSFGNSGKGAETRVMIFSGYRDSVKEISSYLNRHKPLIKAMNFMGQNQKAGTSKGFTQKEQLMVVKKFREGGYNVLVSTCVGEEGLDIGEIDLIVCYDAPKSPIRLVQRMGRTGRKRAGRIVVLLAEGKEEQAYRESNSRKQSVHRAILNGVQLGGLYQGAPTMVPRGITPSCHRMFMTVPEYHSAGGSKSAAQRAPGQASIASLLMSGKRAKERSALTRQEQLYYEAHYEVAESTIPSVPTVSTSFATLGGAWTPELDETAPRRPALTLSNWILWQNTFQPTLHVSHSQKTEDFVHLMQFIDNLRLTDNCIDTYGLEMKTFLRMEDVTSDPETDDCLDDCGKVACRKKDAKKPTGPGSKAPLEQVAVLKKGKIQSKRKDRNVVSVGAEPSFCSFGIDGSTSGKQTTKKKTITDFFKERPEPDDSSTRASVEEMDCVEVIESEDDRPEGDDQNNVLTLEELFRLSPEQECGDRLGWAVNTPRAEIRTPPSLEVDVFPCGGSPLSPVDIGQVLGQDGLHESAVVSSCELETSCSLFLIDVANDLGLGSPCKTDVVEVGPTATKLADGESPGTPERAGRSMGGAVPAPTAGPTTNSRFWSSKLELDSDLEDMLDEDCLEEEVNWSQNRAGRLDGDPEPAEESVAEEAPFQKVRSQDTRPAIFSVALPRPLDGPLHSTPCKPMLGSSTNKGTPVIKAFIASPEVSGQDIRPEIPSVAPPRHLDLPSHSTPCKPVPGFPTSKVTPISKAFIASPEVFCQDITPEISSVAPSRLLDVPSHSTPCKPMPGSSTNEVTPIRKAFIASPIRNVEAQSKTDAWDLFDDSDEELFLDLSDGQDDFETSEAGAKEDSENLGMTELCALLDQESTVPNEPVPPEVPKSVLSPAPEPPRGRPTGAADLCRLLVREEDAAKDARPRRSLSSTFASLPLGDRTGETSVRSRPTFELSVDLKNFGFSSDESSGAASEKEVDHDPPPAVTVGPSCELPPSRGWQPSKPVPVALVKPMVATRERGPVFIVSSEEESPVRVRRKVARRKAVLSDPSSSDSDVPSLPKKASARTRIRLESSDEDFQGHEVKKKAQRESSPSSTIQRRLQCSETNQRREPSRTKKKGRPREPGVTRKENIANQFIEQEADVSADVIHSSDESENSSLDEMDGSFIDDQTQAPNKSLYLHAVRSPIGVGRFKIGHSAEAHAINVYSQAVSEDEADYICDSFCVGSSEPDCPFEPEKEVQGRRITRRRKEKKTKHQKRRIHVSLSDEDNEESVCATKASRISVSESSNCQTRRQVPADERLLTEGPSQTSRFPLAESLWTSAAAERSSDLQGSVSLNRERRLNLQRLRQDEFRQKHQKEQSLQKCKTLNERLPTDSTSSFSGCVQEARVEDVSIIVDSRGIASGPALVSMLRAKQGVDVHVHSLDVGDFLLSRRMCVIRKSWIDFGNSQNHARLLDEVRRLFELYDRPCIILEKSQRTKPGERTFKRTKYFDSTLVSLASTHTKLLFSDSQENTAELILTLARKEQQKGMALASLHFLRDKKEAVQFYLGVPKVSLAMALNFAAGFRSIGEFLNSSVERVQQVGKTTRSRAKDIVNFCSTSGVV